MVYRESPAKGYMPTSNPGSDISVGGNRSNEGANKGYMSLEESPNPGPGDQHNPNGIQEFIEQNWQGLAVGIGIGAFLIWLFSKK